MTENNQAGRSPLYAQHQRDRLEALRESCGEGFVEPRPPEWQVAGALDAGVELGGIAEALAHTRPRAVVIDRLLNTAAFQQLQQYLTFADVWGEVAHGMLAAHGEALRAIPLLRQLADELRHEAPSVFGCHPDVSFWAFKCLLPEVGTGIHADSAAVTANIWLTDDAANLDLTSGGLVVWDATPPTQWQRPEYNSQGEDHQALIRRHIDAQAPLRLHIPYRANRCVVFQSTLFHASDRPNFADSFSARRMNLTLLFSGGDEVER